MHGFSMNIQIISAFELTATNVTVEGNDHVLPFDVFVHVGGFIGGIITLSASPGHKPM